MTWFRHRPSKKLPNPAQYKPMQEQTWPTLTEDVKPHVDAPKIPRRSRAAKK